MNRETLAEPAPRTLIADDHPDVLAALRLLLKGEGFQTESANSPAAVIEAVSTRPFDLVLIDLNYTRDTTSGQEGLDLISRIRAIDETLPVVAMTAWGSVELAVEAMREGIADFVQKPWENARLLKTLRRQVEAGRERRREQKEREARSRELEQEMEAAREMQQSLLPSVLPPLAGCEVAAAWRPARAVGGDFFDVLKFDERRAALCVGDVAGKGMSAALLMSSTLALVRASASPHLLPREMCARLNRALCGMIAEGRFITFFYGLLDLEKKRFTYANAGHNPPLLVAGTRAGGGAIRLMQGGPVLGVLPGGGYEQGEVTLAAGDRLLFYTDGITEARDAAGEEFGEERLVAYAAGRAQAGITQLPASLLAAVTEFCGGQLQDDATLLTVAALGQG
jgi:phosphoserine phosphatase RsbU/P